MITDKHYEVCTPEGAIPKADFYIYDEADGILEMLNFKTSSHARTLKVTGILENRAQKSILLSATYN